jgi:hypothetical protein
VKVRLRLTDARNNPIGDEFVSEVYEIHDGWMLIYHEGSQEWNEGFYQVHASNRYVQDGQWVAQVRRVQE